MTGQERLWGGHERSLSWSKTSWLQVSVKLAVQDIEAGLERIAGWY